MTEGGTVNETANAEAAAGVATAEVEDTWWQRRGDLAVTIMLASITLLLAWSGFQASKWGGVQAINFSDAGKARTDSDIYVLATVVFAAALFLVGLCQKLRKQAFQQAVFFVAVVVALVGAFIVVTQPVEFVTSDLGL